MKIQPVCAPQLSEIDIYRPTETVPAGKALLLLAFNVPQVIAHVLKIESDTSFQQTRSFTSPFAEQVAVRTLPCLMTVRATKRLVVLVLRVHRSQVKAKPYPKGEQDLDRSYAHVKELRQSRSEMFRLENSISEKPASIGNLKLNNLGALIDCAVDILK